MSFYAFGGAVYSKNEVLRNINGGFVWIFDYKAQRDRYVELDCELSIIGKLSALRFMHNFNAEFAERYMDRDNQDYSRIREVVHIESMYENIIKKVHGLDVHIIGGWEPDF